MYYARINDEVPIGKVFDYETDFTNWQSTNLNRLGRVLSMKLKLVGIEERLGSGPKRVDIMADEYDLDIPVVVENQFGRSDDRHLGQLLSYAALTNAGAAIWISEEFSWDHIQAIQWINENSFESFQLFGIKVFFRQSSLPEYKTRFEVADHPFRQSSKRKFVSWDNDCFDIGMYRDFWQSLIQDQRISKFTASKRVFNRRYHYFPSGFGGIRYVVRFKPITETVSVCLEVARPERNEVFDQLENDREDIEHTFGDELNRENSEHRNFHRIGVEETGSIVDSTDETKRWMIDNLVRLKEVFGPYLDELAR